MQKCASRRAPREPSTKSPSLVDNGIPVFEEILIDSAYQQSWISTASPKKPAVLIGVISINIIKAILIPKYRYINSD
jgi:hypothetical protein